jgi:hypothetical protein
MSSQGQHGSGFTAAVTYWLCRVALLPRWWQSLGPWMRQSSGRTPGSCCQVSARGQTVVADGTSAVSHAMQTAAVVCACVSNCTMVEAICRVRHSGSVCTSCTYTHLPARKCVLSCTMHTPPEIVCPYWLPGSPCRAGVPACAAHHTP